MRTRCLRENAQPNGSLVPVSSIDHVNRIEITLLNLFAVLSIAKLAETDPRGCADGEFKKSREKLRVSGMSGRLKNSRVFEVILPRGR